MKMFLKACLLFVLISSSAYALTTTISASMKVMKTLLVDVTQDILMPTIFTTNHNQILSGDTTVIPGGVNGHNGAVRITGAAGYSVTITVPSNMNLSNGTDTVALALATINTPNTQTLDVNGIADYTIAGTLPATLVDRGEGNYAGVSAPVTVIYQ